MMSEANDLRAVLNPKPRNKCILESGHLQANRQQRKRAVMETFTAVQGLAFSLFERLQQLMQWTGNSDVSCQLRRQYRMNAGIMELPNKHIYGGQLIADSTVVGQTAGQLQVHCCPRLVLIIGSHSWNLVAVIVRVRR